MDFRFWLHRPQFSKSLAPEQPSAWVLYWLLGGLLFRSIVAIGLLPGWDEAYYYLYSQHLDWSYFDHPVMVALTSGFGLWLTGIRSQFTIRMAALLIYTGSLWMLYLTARHLWGQRSAQLTLAIATLTPLFTLGFGTLTSPDNGLMFFWSGVLYLAVQEFFPAAAKVNRGESPPAITDYRPTYRIAVIGLLVGLAAISKYHGFLLGLGLVLFCLTSPSHRKALWSPWTALSFLAFGIALLPLLLWNWQHDWISFRFHLGIRFENDGPTRFSLLQLLGVFGMEIGYLFPAIGLPLWWVSLRGAFQQLQWTFAKTRPADQIGFFQRQGFILWVGLPVMLGFTLLGGAKHIFPSWPAPGLWGMTLLLGYRAAHWSSITVKRWLAWSGWIIGSLLTVVFLHLTLGIFQKPGHYAIFGGFLTPQQDPVNELIDSVQLNRKLQEDTVLREALNNADFIFTNEYYLGGYLDMAVRSLTTAPVTSFTQDPRGFAFWFHPEEHFGENALYLTIDRYAEQVELTDSYRPYFENIEKIGEISTERQGAVTETFHIYKANNLLKPYRYPYP